MKNAAMNVLAKKASSPKHPLTTKTQSLDEMKQTVHSAQEFLRKGQQTTRFVRCPPKALFGVSKCSHACTNALYQIQNYTIVHP